MKRNLCSHIFEIYCLKYTIPKFQMFRVQIDDFTSLQSLAILPSKMAREWVRVKPKISQGDVIWVPEVCLRIEVLLKVKAF